MAKKSTWWNKVVSYQKKPLKSSNERLRKR
jgi:hypothetical protein